MADTRRRETSVARRETSIARRESKRGTQNGGKDGIVQVNTSPLEVYLQGLKKQILRHEEELQHPSWWEKIKSEVDKIPSIARKLDHSQLDIAGIRTFITEQSDRLLKCANPEVTEVNEKVEFLKGELEAARLLIRRIELHQATEVAALREVTNMRTALKDLQVAVADDSTGERIDTLELDVNTLDQVLHQQLDDAVSDLKGVTGKQQTKLLELDNTVDKLRNYVDSEVVKVVEDNAKIMRRLSDEDDGNDSLKKKAEMNRKINELFEVCGGGRLTKLVSYNLAVLKMGNALKIRRKWELRVCFAWWKKQHGNERHAGGAKRGVASPLHRPGSPIVGSNGMQFVDHSGHAGYVPPAVRSLGDLILGVSSKCYQAFTHHSLTNALLKWREHTMNQKVWEKHKNRMVPVLVYWHNRTSPDLKRYLQRWRLQALLKRIGIEQEQDNGRPKASWRPLEFNLIDYENAHQQVNLMVSRLSKLRTFYPRNREDTITATEVHSAATVIANTMSVMGRKSVQTDIVARGCARDLKKTDDKLDKGLDELNRKLHSRFEVAEKSLMAYKTSITMKFADVGDQIEAIHSEIDTKQNANDERFKALELRTTNLEAHSATTDAKIDRVLLLQGNILERIQVIEDRISAIEGSNKTRDVEVAQALKSSVAAMQDVAHAKAQTKDSLTYFDEELKYLKVFSRRLNDDLKQCMVMFTEQTGKSKAVSKELKRRLENVTDVLDLHVRGEPLPEELFSMYRAYEQRVVESQAMGRASSAFTDSIASEVAKFAHRLAEHVAKEVDLKNLYRLVCGPKPPPPTSSGSKDPKGNGTTAGLINENTSEEGVLAQREELLQNFNSAYLALLDKPDAAPTGHARAEARIIFHRRFVAAVEAALSKYDALVMVQGQSFLGTKGNKAQSSGPGTNANSKEGENCMACNRPLSVPRYKGAKSWQQMLLSSQPAAPALIAIEGNTKKVSNSSPPITRSQTVVEIPSGGVAASPHRHTAVYSAEAKIAMSEAQVAALSALAAAELPEETGSTGVTLADGNASSNILLTNASAASPVTFSAPIALEPSVAQVSDGGVEVSQYESVTHHTGDPNNPRTVVLQTKVESIDQQQITNYAGNRGVVSNASASRRPVSASASGRHKTAIKDAYVMRGGFKMKIPSPKKSSGSESSSALVFHQAADSKVPGLARTQSVPNTRPDSANLPRAEDVGHRADMRTE